MKVYRCKLREGHNGDCKYAGNKVFNWGFVSGTDNYCRKVKRFVSFLSQCPLPKEKHDSETTGE